MRWSFSKYMLAEMCNSVQWGNCYLIAWGCNYILTFWLQYFKYWFNLSASDHHIGPALPDLFNMTPFGILLTELRMRHCASLADLAHGMGMQESQLSAICRGRFGPPSADLCDRVGYALALGAEDLRRLRQAAQNSQRRVILTPADSPQAFELISSFLRARSRKPNPAVFRIAAQVLELSETN